MRKYIVAYMLALCGVLFPVLPVQAATPLYAGNLQVMAGANLQFLGLGAGCVLTDANGKAFIAACPTGTVAFSAAAPFTISGSSPYIIGCPTCFTTAGGTITGATVINAATTIGAQLNVSSGIHVTAGGITSDTGYPSVVNALRWDSGGSGGMSGIGASGSLVIQGVTASLFQIGDNSNNDLAMDISGNMGVRGNVTAPTFFSTSLRSHKQDIQPLSLDALQVLHDTDWASFRYLKKYGDPHQAHIGFIADDTPSVLSGPKHDHFDAQALATVDAQAILQLDKDIQVLWVCCAFLAMLLVVVLGVALMKKNEE